MKRKKTDRDAIVVLLILIVLCLAIYPYIDDIIGNDNHDKATELTKQQRFAATGSTSDKYYDVKDVAHELFAFDPNTADSTQLLRLGLRPWQVRNIYKYRAKGGRYNKPSDFARLYGLTAKEYERLLPYITIKPEAMAADVYGGEDEVQRYPAEEGYDTGKEPAASEGDKPFATNYPVKIKQGEHININTADTTELKRIPGIGSFYARRIVALRERLGGMYSIAQCRDIDDFPETALQYMTVGQKDAATGVPAGVKRIKVNSCGAKEMSRHPYIRYVQAKQIEELRSQEGRIKSANELRRLPSFTDEMVDRLAPYLEF